MRFLLPLSARYPYYKLYATAEQNQWWIKDNRTGRPITHKVIDMNCSNPGRCPERTVGYWDFSLPELQQAWVDACTNPNVDGCFIDGACQYRLQLSPCACLPVPPHFLASSTSSTMSFHRQLLSLRIWKHLLNPSCIAVRHINTAVYLRPRTDPVAVIRRHLAPRRCQRQHWGIRNGPQRHLH